MLKFCYCHLYVRKNAHFLNFISPTKHNKCIGSIGFCKYNYMWLTHFLPDLACSFILYFFHTSKELCTTKLDEYKLNRVLNITNTQFTVIISVTTMTIAHIVKQISQAKEQS